MKVEKNTVVSLDIELFDVWGNLLERSSEPVLYLHGHHGGIVPALETALEAKEAGASMSLRLEPEEAFGEYDEQLVRIEARDRFPETLEVGMQFEGVPGEAQQDEQAEIYIVTDIAKDAVVLDANHPYAGIAVEFKCKVLDVRPATPVEIEHGHVHDAAHAPLHIVTH